MAMLRQQRHSFRVTDHPPTISSVNFPEARFEAATRFAQSRLHTSGGSGSAFAAFRTAAKQSSEISEPAANDFFSSRAPRNKPIQLSPLSCLVALSPEAKKTTEQTSDCLLRFERLLFTIGQIQLCFSGTLVGSLLITGCVGTGRQMFDHAEVSK
jgi:hypothetical protein